ncbi:O(6)-methylguanine-induced apoptosis 2-like [Patiria miniata]|uniref:O(6)-methylguanine-induced apoptosis 2 n=1 Tax=Patiria miniata TaxID=46514 RepID=A0A914A0Q6_PATMI|nr:O(6)-methylguanine-induced apoptosis 2-like [Patiria miniata]
MADSVQTLEPGYRRSVGGERSGRLHKGPGVVAATSSIPTKYQTIVTPNTDKRGFGGTTKRFNHDVNVNENPGPGTYGNLRVAAVRDSSSFSKKGVGVGFVSKTRRMPRQKGTPGPGSAAYNLPSLLRTQTDCNQAPASSSFHKPIAVAQDKRGDQPAPNQYNISDSGLHKHHGSQFQASFKSTSKRIDFQGPKTLAPAPCQYNISDSLTKPSANAPTSSFKSTTKRQMAVTPADNPGPGQYRPHEPVEEPANRLLMPRKHYLCISAPAMPLPPPLPEPGPGSYELVNYKGAPKHYMSGAVFVSTTSRWTGNLHRTSDNPGPATYRPEPTNKGQSFLYNAQKKWVCP